jgi:prepilin-type N-terminal cleavage/methylation domain-containing protein
VGSSRHAFTLLELLLVLAVLAAVAAIVFPRLDILLEDRQLVRAGEQVRIEMSRLRVEAMRQGRVMMLQGLPEGSQLRSQPYYSLSDSIEAIDQTGSQSGLLSGAQQANLGAPPTDMTAGGEASAAANTIELPEGIQVASVACVSAARAMEIEQQTVAEGDGDWGQPVLFYPDGTTSTAAVTLTQSSGGRVVVKLRGITGDATVSEVLP